MKKTNIYILGGLAILMILGLFFVSAGGGDRGDDDLNATSTEDISGEVKAGDEPEAGLPSVNAPTKKPSAPAGVKTPSQAIVVTLPVAGAQFVINQNNIITWSREPGVTGAIYLIEAETGAFVGWITPTITSHQVSYTWDTRDVLLSRQGGLKKPITKGNYIIKIRFDNAQAEATSAKFSVIYASEVPIISYDVSIQNLALTPKSLILNKGEKVVLKNNDTIVHKIIGSGFGGINLLDPGESMLIETANMGKGVYEYYSEGYPTIKLMLTVK